MGMVEVDRNAGGGSGGKQQQLSVTRAGKKKVFGLTYTG